MKSTDDLQALLTKGAKLYGAGQTAAAAAVYRKAREIAPQDPTVRLRLALAIWHGENRAEEALAEIQSLAETYPQASVLGAAALILNSLGRFAEAAVAARQAVEADPAYSSAWRDLATATPADGAVELDAEIAERLRDTDLSSGQRRDMHSARAAALRKLDRQEDALTQTECAHGYAQRRWDADRERKGISDLRETFTPDVMQRLFAQGPSDRRMIFIMGMPRSGTTLLERMLVAHPGITSAGETTIVGNLWNQYRKQKTQSPSQRGKALTPQLLRAMADALLRGIAQRTGPSARVIDKMPANYLYLPLIRLMLPGATVLHMRRHPLDTCLSCYEASFTFGLDYATSQVSLGNAYRHYAEVMAHWTGPVGISVHEVRYERLVTEPEQVLRPVLAAIGLDWDPACLAPADGGVIKTASSVQARGGLSTGSVGRWRAFEHRLQPLIETLGGLPAIEALDRG